MATDGAFVEGLGGGAACGVEIDDAKEPGLGVEEVGDAVKDGIEVGDLLEKRRG